MNKNLIAFFSIIVIGTLGLVGYYFAKPMIETYQSRSSSDAAGTKGHIKIGIDNWIGYFPLCSKQMKSLMRGAGYLVECIDDQANYPERMENLRKRKIQFAVATVDSYLINGKAQDFPGTIISVIDESKGGDAIIAHKSNFSTLEDLKSNGNYKIAYTPASPSEHLLKSVAIHFDIENLKDQTKIQTLASNGSAEALKSLTKKDADVAILWEPDVSKALEDKNFIKLLGTEDTEKLIVDILLVNRKYSTDNPDVVKLLLSNYFRALKHYSSNQEILISEIKSKTKLKDKQIKNMLSGVKWINLFDNATRWFGISSQGSDKATEGIVETVESTIETLIQYGDFKSSPLPQGNPYFLQNKSYVKELFSSGLKGQFGQAALNQNSSDDGVKIFSPMSDIEWEQLRPVGTLKIRPITFQSGTSIIDESGEVEVAEIIKHLKHYPNFRLKVKGHSGLNGDPQANLSLSKKRAEAVLHVLVSQFNIDVSRMKAYGLGSKQPLRRQDGESNRSYNYRLPRVELQLVNEVF